MELYGCVAGPFQTNCWIAVAGKALTVIDPGMGAFATVDGYIKDNGLRLEKVILTHGHIDHTRDAGSLQQAYDVPVFIHADDEFMLDDPAAGVSVQAMALHDADHLVTVDPQARSFFSDGDSITIGGESFAVHHAPGHSPGSVLLVGKTLCFSGDVLFKGSIGRTDLPRSSWPQMDNTLENKVWPLDDGLQILPGHGPSSTMKSERATNPFLRKFHNR
ncbi:MBL fold metallo-hydrolase [Corynebacterium mendelii]|uniref:MBL fold metallo-hydrolase n=1 Tax=Corynebacterium mendelii TaxID=2765362 RepID=A0A939IX78_9CORY|nr:MBL fold metallo-hydrolase [Corynebacterium mendelii]MBN9643387.1 MBL fold metallo-hydrolase [Corynebacterium mendelii]